MRSRRNLVIVATLILLSALIGCGGSTPPAAPLSQFQPEIVNSPDNFQFQATAISNVSAVVQYTWSNSGSQATVNHSSAVDSGTTLVQVFDSAGTEVHNSALLPSGSLASSVGVAGNWRIRVTLSHAYGTLNFRAEKL